jgi:hypothetical protein
MNLANSHTVGPDESQLAPMFRREQKRHPPIVCTTSLPQKQGSNLHNRIQRAQTRECDQGPEEEQTSNPTLEPCDGNPRLEVQPSTKDA